MRSRSVLCLLLTTLAVAAVAQPPADPVVTNPGFETLADGVAVDWEHVGESVGYSDIARTGTRSLRLVRRAGQTGETGFNRGWEQGSGQPGAMLTRLKGALEFWYRAEALDPDSDIFFYAIPMDDQPLERTGAQRRRYQVPRSHVGDGKWHRALVGYDYSDDPEVKYVHASGRIVGPGGGEVLVDDVGWLPEAGPLPQIVRTRLVPDPADRYGRGTLVVTVQNSGDQPLGEVPLSLELPAGWTAGEPNRGVKGLLPDHYAELLYPITGARRGEQTITVRGEGDHELESRLTLAPELRLLSLVAGPVDPVPGETVTFTALVENRGTAEPDLRVLQQSTGFKPGADEEVVCHLDELRPARWICTWQLEATAAPEHAVTLTVLDGQEPVATLTVPIDVVPARPTGYQPLAGGLQTAPGPGGEARGRLVAGGRTLATLPHLGRVVYRAGDRVREIVPAYAPASDGTLVSTVADPDGGTWRFELAVAPSDDPTLTPVAVRASCDQPREVLAFWGPELLAEGERLGGLLPGVEWLGAGELSSNDLDVAEDHPERLRVTTHPNNITIPLMAVATDRGVVGILWDAHHEWLPGHDRPQPLFASPDRFDRHLDAARLGLMAPNVPSGLPQNKLLAIDEPLRLEAGQTLDLSATLFHDAASRDPLAAQDAWMRVYRPAPVLPMPHGTVEDEIAFSARAYLGPLWDEETGLFWPYLLGPSLGRVPGARLDYPFDLLQFAQRLPDHPQAALARERAEAVLARRGAGPRGEDLGYYAGAPLRELQNTLVGNLADVREWDANTAFGFRPRVQSGGVFKGRDYYELGEPGQEGSGIAAARMRELLQTARLVGERDTYNRLVPSLEKLAAFDVPRAAQVWEIPVHTPDILAAADACEAFLEAYQLSGEPRWLNAARAEARRGMPFVYVWNDEGRPWMRYGTIPVFGATWYRGAWFGRLVQWNGLRFARALVQLAQFDPQTRYGGMTWDDYARGIMVSAMYQQREDDEFVGLWPDGIDLRNDNRIHWEFAPRRILTVLNELEGRVEIPRTATLLPGDEAVRDVPPVELTAPRATISAAALIPAGSWDAAAGVMRVTFRQPVAPAAVRATISGVSEPTNVLIDGRPVPRRDELASASEPAWQHSAEAGLLALVLPAAEEATVELHGIAPQPVRWEADVAQQVAFEFDSGPEGWTPARDLAGLRVLDGLLLTRTMGPDPYLIRGSVDLPGDRVSAIRIRYRVTPIEGSNPGGGQLFWTTPDAPAFSEEHSLRFEVTPGTELAEVRIPVGDHPLWRGQRITGLRIDPTSGEPAEIAIDWVREE